MTLVFPAENSAWSLCIMVEIVLLCLSSENFERLDNLPGDC